MAGVEGLEPSQAVLETDVLPLTLYPYIKIIFDEFDYNTYFFNCIYSGTWCAVPETVVILFTL